MTEPDVTVRVPIYEVDGRDTEYPTPVLLVESHWTSSDRVVLRVSGYSYSVIARDLREACDRARRL